MLSALDRRDRPPEEGEAAGLQGFAVDKAFLSSLKGILLETELVTAATPTWHPQSPSPGPPRPAHRPPSQAFWAPLYHRLPLLHLSASLRPLFWRQLQPVSVVAGRIEGRQDSFLGHRGSASHRHRVEVVSACLSRALRWPLLGMFKKPNYH